MAGILVILLTIPFLFQGKLMAFALEQTQKHLRTTVSFSKIDLSLIRNFPHVAFICHDLTLTGVGAFENDTLFYARKTSAMLNVPSLFAQEIVIKGITLDTPRVYAKVLEDGSANWDITLSEDPSPVPEQETSSLALSLESVRISNATVVYEDLQAGQSALIQGWDGRFSVRIAGDNALINAHSEMDSLSFYLGDIPFLNKVSFEAEALLEADLARQRYQFKDNLLRLNALETAFDGWVQLADSSGMEMDLVLKTEEVSFKDVLSLIPALYLTEFSSLQTEGELTMRASAKGVYAENHYPALNIQLLVEEGMLRYPSLPQSLQNVAMDARITGEGGPLDNLRIDVNRFHFDMGGNPFDMTGSIITPVSDPEMDAQLKGILDLGMIREIYPLDDSIRLQGRVDADFQASGKLSYLEKEQYDLFRMQGFLAVKDFIYQTPEMPGMVLEKARMDFNPKEIVLSAFSMMMGENDIQASGMLGNPLPFLLKKERLEGRLNVSSQFLNLNDFMSDSESPSVADSLPILAFEIPKALDLTLTAHAGEILLNHLTMKNAGGTLRVKEGRITMDKVSAQAMGGTLSFSGYYEAPERDHPVVSMDIALQKVSFRETFQALDMARSLVPIFDKIQGNYSMDLQFNSTLTETLDPVFPSLSGEGLLQSSEVQISDVAVLNALALSLKNDALRQISTKDLKIPFSLKEGRVFTDPFSFGVHGMRFDLSGSTGVDQTIDYSLGVTLPPQMAQAGMTRLQGSIGGSFSRPQVRLDAGNLLQQAATHVVGKLLGNSSSSKDSIGTLSEISSGLTPDEIRAKAKETGDRLIEEARRQGDQLISKAGNALTRLAAEAAAARLKEAAEKEAARLNEEAEKTIQTLEKKP